MIILDGSEGSFLRAIKVPDGFQKTTGLKVNDEKNQSALGGFGKKEVLETFVTRQPFCLRRLKKLCA